MGLIRRAMQRMRERCRSNVGAIPPLIAEQMDPTQKLVLVCAKAALEDAGYESHLMDSERVGVLIAHDILHC